MQINRIRLRHEPGTRIQVWQTRQVAFNLGLGEQLTIENLGYEDIVTLHAVAASALDFSCRPRTVDEITRHRPATRLDGEIWTRVCVDGEGDSPSVSVHDSEQAARDALRAYCGAPDDVADEDLVDYCTRIGYVARIDSHNVPHTI